MESNKMKKITILLVALAGCSGGTGGSGGGETCAALVGKTASAEILEAPCALPDGTTFVGGVSSAECPEGTMVWNDSAWGYIGQPLQSSDTWPGKISGGMEDCQ